MNCPRCFATLPADAPQGLCPKCLLAVGMGEPEVILTTSGEPAPPPPTPESLQPHFPQLEIVKLIGRGGMGAVYEARQRGLARTVALKILAAPANVDASFEERFVREAQALARLSHENIVAVYDAGRAGPHFYLLLEHVDGPNLRQALRAARIEPAQALAIVMQICAALDYAHRQGVVHRDIKPENVLLTREGRVKIADFGLAKVLDRSVAGQRLTRASQTMGTPHYMAPEQIERPQQVDHRADIYSLGVVLYELLTGELPLGRFPLPSHKVQVDVRLDEIVVRTLEKEPERRYQAASEVRSAVHHVATTVPPVASPSPPAEPARRRRLWPWFVGAAALLLVLLAPAALLFFLFVPGITRPDDGSGAPRTGSNWEEARRVLEIPPLVPPAPASPQHARGGSEDVTRRMEELQAESERIGAESERIGAASERIAADAAASGRRAEAQVERWLPGHPDVPCPPLDDPVAEEALALLAAAADGPWQRYLTRESAAVEIAADLASGVIADVLIRPIPDLSDISRETWRVLEASMDAVDIRHLRQIGFERSALPFGWREARLQVVEASEGFEVIATTDAGVRRLGVPELPPEIRRILARDRELRGDR